MKTYLLSPLLALLVLLVCLHSDQVATARLNFRAIVNNVRSDNPLTANNFWNTMTAISSTDWKQPRDGTTYGYSSKLACTACEMGMKSLQYLIHLGAKTETVADLACSLCKHLHVSTPRVCEGLSQAYKDEVVYVFGKISVNPTEICGTIVDQDCGSSGDPKENWTVPLPDVPKPPVTPIPLPKPGSPTIKVLHISDIHFDQEYQEGTNANCDEPLCCHTSSGTPKSGADKAGPWGDYRKCDTSFATMQNVFKRIAATHRIDYILWTGDDPPHKIWNQTQEDHITILKTVASLFQSYFPNTPVFPALGNHEGVPVNSFPPPYVDNSTSSMDWLYDALSKTWTHWLPNETSSTIKTGGFYSVSLIQGFRIISINMNYCNNMNWWLLLDMKDPLNELSWLAHELEKAEMKGEKVHIIGHIPPGSTDCLRMWSYNYYRIVNRFESTIRAQFFGHTHLDEFEIFYEQNSTSKRPFSVAFVGPSVTTYVSVNPSYRIYTIDGNYPESSWTVLDMENYYFNLTEANAYGKPMWKLLYTTKDAYNMTSLQPNDWDDLWQRMLKNDTLFQTFYRHSHRLSDAYPLVCDSKCKKQILCKLTSGQSADYETCMGRS